MSIFIHEESKTFTLQTAATTYQMQVGPLGQLRHLYYGRRTEGDRLDYQFILQDSGFSPNIYEDRLRRNISNDILPQEYSSENTGDFRLASLEVCTESGIYGTDLRYKSHRVTNGKYSIDGMPASFDRDGECQTLTILLEDAATGIQTELLYGVFEKKNVITRAVRILNGSQENIYLTKAASVCLDLPFGKWELLHFHGRHGMERIAERTPLHHGIETISSCRGASSHHNNPFAVLCGSGTNEDSGNCVGVMLMYSGGHRIDAEVDQMHSTRVVAGINDRQFRWQLAPGEAFATPEVLLTFSADGLTSLSHTYHRFIRENVIRSRWNRRRRPVLINNWEATFFGFNSDKIFGIAQQARKLGVEMMVLDDGWFGKRDSDNSGLGDWDVNTEKLPGGLNPLIQRINSLGMKFGIWVEPEMISEDSDLYRAHPDWALTVPGRAPTMSRNQMVLDFSRKEVVDYLYDKLSALLRNHRIDYVKWDMNRHMTDVYSHALPADRQGEVFHRYILGVYDLLERLTTEFPEVLFEGCSGGGGRYDAAMMAYFPQIWCSDNTDPVARMTIQHGSSFGYPISTVGAHVSVAPNQMTGRTTPFGTRAVVAMSGTFGYELDPNEMTEEEKQQVPEQIDRFLRFYDVIQNGDYYRLTDPNTDFFHAWQFAAPDGSEALLNVVLTHARANPCGIHIRLKGLEPKAMYRLDEIHTAGCSPVFESIHMDADTYKVHLFSGSSLMYAGITLPQLFGDYPSVQLHFSKV